MWPSGLRRVTRNHFSSGGVGSNPAIVVFSQKERKASIERKKEKEGIGSKEKGNKGSSQYKESRRKRKEQA